MSPGSLTRPGSAARMEHSLQIRCASPNQRRASGHRTGRPFASSSSRGRARCARRSAGVLCPAGETHGLARLASTRVAFASWGGCSGSLDTANRTEKQRERPGLGERNPLMPSKALVPVPTDSSRVSPLLRRHRTGLHRTATLRKHSQGPQVPFSGPNRLRREAGYPAPR